MKNIIRLLSVFCISLFITIPVFAQEIHSEKSVTLENNTVVNHDYLAAGETVTVSGTVNGDVYLAGGNITVDGTINGDLLAAGGSVQIRGKVKNDIRVFGGTVTISAPVGGSITLGAGNVQITENAPVGGSIVAGTGNIEILAPVSKGITIGAGNVQINNSVGGNVIAGVGKLILGQSARIAGDVTYWSEEEAMLTGDATVGGQLVRHLPPQAPKVPAKQVASAFAGLGIAWGFIEIIGTFILGLLVIALVPVYTKRTVETIVKKPWTALLVGFVAAIVIPIAILIVFITVIGIKVGLVLVALAGLLCIFTKVFAALFLGTKALGLLKQKENLYVSLAIGLFLFVILGFVPFLGWIIAAGLSLMGLGGILTEKKQFYQTLRSRHLI